MATNTYDTLNALINATPASKAQLRFQSSSFSPDSATLFDQELIGGLNLLNPTLVGQSTDQNFQLTGASSTNPFILDGLTITVDITNSTGLINTIKAQPPSGPGFKLLFNNVLSLLSVNYLISYSGSTYNFNYSINVDVSTELANLVYLFPNAPGSKLNNLQFIANINNPGGDQNPYLIFSPSISNLDFPSIGTFQIRDVSFNLLTFVSWAYQDPDAKTGKYPLSANTLQIAGVAAFESIAKQINLTTQFALNPKQLFLSGIVTEISKPLEKTDLTFNDLLTLVPGTNLSQALPNNLPFIDSFGLGGFTMGINVASTIKINSFHLALGTTPTFSWQIIPNILSLEKLEIDFGVTFGSGTNVSASILGVFELDGNPDWLFDVSGSYPQYVFRAFSAWDPTKAPTLGKLLQGPLGNNMANPFEGGSDPIIESVDITVDAGNKSYSASLLIDPEVSLSFGSSDPWFKITELGFDISYLQSNFSGTIYGVVVIGTSPAPVFNIYLSGSYSNSNSQATWSFNGNLQNQVSFTLSQLITSIFTSYTPPTWLSDVSLTIKTLSLSYTKAATTSYQFDLDAVWAIDIPNLSSVSLETIINVGKNPGGTGPEGLIKAIADFHGCEVAIEVDFTDADKIYKLTVNIEDDLIVSGTYDSAKKTASLTFSKIPSLGQVLSFLIDVAEPGMELILPDPWNILNDIQIPGTITLDYDFNNKAISIEFDYTVDLLLVTLSGIKVTYIPKSAQQDKQVMVQVTGKLITGEDFSPGWNALNPQSTPQVPGKPTPFELKYLGVGQHVSPRNMASINTVTDAINSLANAFNKQGGDTKGQPIAGTGLEYNSGAGWLIGADFSILEVFDMSIVFLDPLLYGMLINVQNKDSAKPFGGLQFEILYKKVNDTTGMYYIYLTLPTVMRHLEFGEVSVTLPSLKLWIYTDGSFKIDMGFPDNDNWNDSFGLEIFPFVGQGGFYFGVLKGGDVNFLPNTYGNGTFNPVVELGLALRVGLGKDINEGIMSAGISITVAGTLQGMLTFYHPNNGGEKSTYFTLSAMLAIIGKIYGSINFAIISARLDITAMVSIRATFALYEPVLLNFKAYVSVELTVSIHIIFTIHIHLHFSMTVSESFTIGHQTTPPWGTGPQTTPRTLNLNNGASRLSHGGPMVMMESEPILMSGALTSQSPLNQSSFDISTAILGPETINLLFSPHYTTSGGKAQAILMTYIDSYDGTSGGTSGSNSFGNFATGLVRWLATTVLVNNGQTTIAAINAGGGSSFIDQQTITSQQLQQLANYFTQNPYQPLAWKEVRGFLNAFLSITVNMPSGTSEMNATVFPIIPSFNIVVPDGAIIYPPGTHSQTIAFSQGGSETGYTGIQLNQLNAFLQSFKVNNQNAADQAPVNPTYTGGLISASEIIFVDFVTMMAKHVIQEAGNLFAEYDVTPTTSSNFMSFINEFGFTQNNYEQILFDNRNQTLNSTYQFQMATVNYQLKATDITGNVTTDLNNIVTNNKFGALTAADVLAANPGIKMQLDNNGQPVPVLETGAIISIPPFTQALSSLSNLNTLLDLANYYHVNVSSAVAVQLRQINGNDWSQPMPLNNQQNIMNTIFAVGTDKQLRLCNLNQMTVGDLNSALEGNSTFANLSGMTARFMLHGLQLPQPPSLGTANPLLSGLYLLTQQQIDVSALPASPHISSATITISQTQDPNYKLSSLSIPNPSYSIGATDVSYIQQMNADFSALLNFSGLAPMPKFQVVNKHFALRTKISVVSPQPFNSGITGPGTLWKLDTHLMQILQKQPQPAGYSFQLFKKQQITDNNVNNEVLQTFFMPSTLLKFQVRRVEKGKDTGTFIPNVYELHSVDTESIRLLTLLEEAGATTTPTQFRLMYPDVPIRNGYATPTKLIDGGLSNNGTNPDLFIVQSNLSEISNPVATPDTPINDQLTRYLLEAGVVQTGGYYMYYKNPGTNEGLPDYLFSDKQPDTEVTLLISYNFTPTSIENLPITNFQNYIAYQGQIDMDNENLFLEAYLSSDASYDPAVQHKAPVAPPGTVDFIFSKPAVVNTAGSDADVIVENLFHLISYNINGNSYFNNSSAAMPVGPLKLNKVNSSYNNQSPDGGDSGTWSYEGAVSVYPLLKTTPADTDPNMPPNSNNPYNANGKEVSFALNWVDIFGNELLSSPFISSTNQIAYTDEIMHPGEWPHLINNYEIIKNNPSSQSVFVNSNFAFNYAPFLPESNRKTHLVENPLPDTPQWVLKAQNSLQKYQHIYYQYTAATIDSSPDMQIQIGSTIGFPTGLGDPFSTAVNQVPISTFINFIKSSYIFLKGASSSQLKITPYQIPSNTRMTISAICSANNIATQEQTQAFLAANQGLPLQLQVGSIISIPCYLPNGSNTPKAVKGMNLFAYTTTAPATIQNYLTTWLLDLTTFETLNPDFAGQPGTTNIPKGTTLYFPVYNYPVTTSGQTLADVATATGVPQSLLSITNPAYSSGTIPQGSVLLVSLPHTQVVPTLVPVPGSAPFRLFVSTTAISGFSAYTGISNSVLQALNPGVITNDTLPANTQIILPTANIVLNAIGSYNQDLLSFLNPKVTFPLTVNTAMVVPDQSASISVNSVLDATWLSLIGVLNSLGSSLELYNLFNTSSNTTQVPAATIVNIPVAWSAGTNTYVPATIQDFSTLCPVSCSATVTTAQFANSFGIDPGLFASYNPEAALLVSKGTTVLIPCSTYTVQENNTTITQLAQSIGYTGSITDIENWLSQMNPGAGGTFNQGSIAKIPIPQAITVQTSEALDTTNNNSIFELQVKLQASRRTGAAIENGAPDEVTFKSGYINPDYRSGDANGALSAGPPLTLAGFATEIEQALPGFKVATADAKETDPDSRFKEIWLVNLPAISENSIYPASEMKAVYSGVTLTDGFYNQILDTMSPSPAQITQLETCRSTVCWRTFNSENDAVNAASACFPGNWNSGGNYEAIVSACVQQGNAQYYCIPPLINYLVANLNPAGTPIYEYSTGTYLGDTFNNPPAANKTFKNVDMESMLQDFLLSIDNFLLPQYAVPAFQFETQPGQKYKPYTDVLNYKDILAQSIAQTVLPVLSSDNVPQPVIDQILTELRIRLSNVYAFDCIGYLPMTANVDLSTTFPEAYLHGQALGAVWNDGSNPPNINYPAFSISPSNIKFSKDVNTTSLVFLFSTKQENLQRSFPVTFDFQINKIEHNIENVKVSNSTIPVGEWLSFVIPFDESGPINLKVPIPLRSYPQAPNLVSHSAAPFIQQFGGGAAISFADENPDPSPISLNNLQKAAAWIYEFDYKYAAASQDTLNIGLETTPANTKTQNKRETTTSADLLEALLQFEEVMPAIKADLNKFLVQQEDTSPNKINTLIAVRSFAFIVDYVLKAYQAWSTDKLQYQQTVTSNEYFEIYQGDEKDDEYNLIVQESQSTNVLSPPIVILDGYTSNWSDITGGLPARNITFTNKDGSVLTPENGTLITQRTIRFDLNTLNILDNATAKANMSVTRNEYLIDGFQTNPAFLYQSPRTDFVNPVHPTLQPDPATLPLYLTTDGNPPPNQPDKLDNYLANFFYGLNNKQGGKQYLQICCNYAYTLAGNNENSIENLQVSIPVILTTPSETDIPGTVNSPTSYITQIKKMIGKWFSANQPTREQAYFLFDISVFSNKTGNTLPILQLRDVQLEVKNIDLTDLNNWNS